MTVLAQEGNRNMLVEDCFALPILKLLGFEVPRVSDLAQKKLPALLKQQERVRIVRHEERSELQRLLLFPFAFRLSEMLLSSNNFTQN